MNRKLIVAVAAGVVAACAGVGYAATQSAPVTSACVNDTNGLMRAAEACRDGEHRVSIGAEGGGAAVTQNGTFSLAPGAGGGGKTLPLTGATVSGRCETSTAPFGGEAATARVLVEAPAGKTMDFFPTEFDSSPSGVASRLLPPAASAVSNMGASSAIVSAVFTANGATATLTIGGSVAPDSHTCTLLWQAAESPN